MIQIADKPLNMKQQLFVEYYTVGDLVGNATQSALKAGYCYNYSDRACKYLVGNSRVKAAIDKKMAELRQLRVVTAEIQTERITKQYNSADAEKDHRTALAACEQLNKHIDYYGLNNASLSDKALTINILPPKE